MRDHSASGAAGDYRPIEEIIGWKMMRSPASGLEVWRDPSSQLFGSPSPSVDDLLAWLRSQWCGLSMEIYSDGVLPEDGWNLIAEFTDYYGVKHWSVNICAPTLLSAAEQAIREVGNRGW